VLYIKLELSDNPAVVTTNVIGPTQDPSITLMIQVANVEFWPRTCFLFQPRTEQTFGTFSSMEKKNQILYKISSFIKSFVSTTLIAKLF